MRCLLTAILLLQGLLPAYAQLDNSALEQRFPPDTTSSQTLSLDLFSFNYFRNYEYFNRFADGITYYGLQLRPLLVYKPNPYLSLYGGVFLSKDFGDEDFHLTEPVLGIRYEKNGISFISGAIEPHLSHGYIEPLLDYDNSITAPVEYGTQLKFDRPRHRTDLWISWKNMIYKPSAEQEEILGGLSTSLRLLKKNGQSLSLPLQFLGWHRGGQVDTTSLPVITNLNIAAGFEYAWEREGAVKKILTRNYVAGFSSSGGNPYKSGKAVYLNAGIETRWLDAMVSYWQANKFAAPAGAPVFQSVSSNIDYPGFKQDDRRLLFLRLKKDFTLAEELFVSARLEPFWDFDGRYADHSMSLFLVYKG
ncbi:MAG TPA: hypothetical protein VD772_11755, partial [Anseongella sp.]|nr:hypothetical protein [Anseongella sp.]